jgi:hypothetical protein
MLYPVWQQQSIFCILTGMKAFVLPLLVLLSASCAFADLMVKDGMVTADLQAVQLHDVIAQLGTATGIHTSIDNAAANVVVYANFSNMPIGPAIRKLLEGTDINYAMIADAGGKPTAIYISRSESPGAGPKRLDTRPVNNSPTRGVVQPVSPQPMPMTPPNNPRDPRTMGQQPQQPGQPGQPGGQKPAATPTGGDSVPTAGSFTGQPPPPQQPQLARPDTKPEIANDDSGDDDDDSDDE